MTIESITFLDLTPFSAIADDYIKSKKHIKEIFIAGARKKVHFYVANQTQKIVKMIRWGYGEYEPTHPLENQADETPQEYRFYEEEKLMIFSKGQMLPMTHLYQFDLLFKGLLNEIDLFVDIDGLHELIEYQQDNYSFNLHAIDSRLTPPSEFRDVRFKHIFLRSSESKSIADILKKEADPTRTKQEQRERSLLDWLKDRDFAAVSRMKKSDVWEELRKIDQGLFSVESKNFFRVQNIITFKPGRKSS